jgi:hypothetical protein
LRSMLTFPMEPDLSRLPFWFMAGMGRGGQTGIYQLHFQAAIRRRVLPGSALTIDWLRTTSFRVMLRKPFSCPRKRAQIQSRFQTHRFNRRVGRRPSGFVRRSTQPSRVFGSRRCLDVRNSRFHIGMYGLEANPHRNFAAVWHPCGQCRYCSHSYESFAGCPCETGHASVPPYPWLERRRRALRPIA